MLAALVFLAGSVQAPTVAHIDAMARARDVEGLSRLLAPLPPGELNPILVLKTGGAYDSGKSGWSAAPLSSPLGEADYVVLSTQMTSEDVGQIVLKRVGLKLQLVPEDDAMGIKIARHRFDLKLVPAQKRAVLIDEMTFRASGKTPTFMFRMSPQYVVSSITDEAGKTVPFRESRGVVVAKRPAGDAVYKIAYSAIVDLPNFAGSISQTEATLTNDYWYPLVARQPAPYDITVHSPKKWIAVAQGELISEHENPTERVTKYKMDLPTVYLSVSAAPYKVFNEFIGGRRFSVWSMRMSQPDMQSQAELYAPIVKFYERFSPFPFSGYGAVDSAVYGGGALEAYSFATYGGGLPYEDAHEPSHTWWGGILPNTYLHSFWNESFADYSDGMYHREVAIGNRDERRLAFIQDGSANPAYRQFAVSKAGVYAGSVASALGYGKGAQVLQMLEQLIGTDRMTEAMAQWIKETPRGESAEWEGFEKAAEEVAPEEHLASFFSAWLDRPGYAKFSVSDVGYGSGAVHFQLTFEGQTYPLPLDVMLQYADGTRQFTQVKILGSGPVSIPSAQKPSLVSIDPWRRVLREVQRDETPVSIGGLVSAMQRFTDLQHPGDLAGVGSKPIDSLPGNLDGVIIVGRPDTLPQMKPYLNQAGFTVDGDKLTYDGTTIDLNHGAAVAVLDTPSGRVAIGLGKTRVQPDFGRARLALVDDLGRFQRGITEPKTSGYLTFKLEP